MHIFQNGSLVIHDVAPEDSGRYTCIAGNSCNIKHTEAPLYVVGMSRGQEVVGPDFFLIFVLIGPLYTGALKPFLWQGCYSALSLQSCRGTISVSLLGEGLSCPTAGLCMSVLCAGDVLVLQCFLSGLLQEPHISLGGQGEDQFRMHQDEFSFS